MKILCHEDTLRISEVAQLTATEVAAFRSAVLAALGPGVRHVEIELSDTEHIDCAGVGALLGLRRSLRQNHAQATVSLFEPSPWVRRLLQLTRTDQLFPLIAAEYAQAA